MNRQQQQRKKERTLFLTRFLILFFPLLSCVLVEPTHAFFFFLTKVRCTAIHVFLVVGTNAHACYRRPLLLSSAIASVLSLAKHHDTKVDASKRGNALSCLSRQRPFKRVARRRLTEANSQTRPPPPRRLQSAPITTRKSVAARRAMQPLQPGRRLPRPVPAVVARVLHTPAPRRHVPTPRQHPGRATTRPT